MKKTHILKKVVYTTLIILFASSFINAEELNLKDFDKYIEKAVREFEVPGLSIAIVKDDKILFSKGYGFRNREKKTPVDDETLFPILSTSKAFTATLIGILVDEGKIKWSSKIIDILPNFRMKDPYTQGTITIRDILSHRSGLSGWEGDWLLINTTRTRDEIAYKVRYMKQRWPLGTRYDYNNVMYLVAGQMIEKVTGKRWEENIHERIFKPLGMISSFALSKELKPGARISTPYDFKGGKLVPIKLINFDHVAPAGSIISNNKDMAKWIMVNLNKGVYKGKRLWSESVQKELFELHINNNSSRYRPSAVLNNFFFYGLGWYVFDYRGSFTVMHGGSAPGFYTRIAMLPKQKIGIVLLSNMSECPLLSPLMYRFYDIYTGAPKNEWTDTGKPRSYQKPKPPKISKLLSGKKPTLELERYTGKFRNIMHDNLEVKNENGRLVLVFEKYYPEKLNHLYMDTFRTDDMREVVFSIDANANISNINVQFYGDFKPFKK